MELGVAGSNPVSHPINFMNTQNQTITSVVETPISISKYTEALIKTYTALPKVLPPTATKLSVSQTVSLAAFIYEKMRNAIEYREEHLIRRAAIDRTLRRRLVLNQNGKDIAEPLIKEMLWARYLENNTIPEEKIGEIQETIDKYIYLRNEFTVGRPKREEKEITSWILDAVSCEIEERLCPDPKREAFTNYVYQILRPMISLADPNINVDVQIYIAVERAFAKSDDPLIRYHLLELLLPELTKGDWKTAERLLPQFGEVYKQIERDITYKKGDLLKRFIKKQTASFLILRDLFETYTNKIQSILTSEEQLKFKVDEICRKRYTETQSKLRRAGVRSFIYIVLTKIIFAVALEIPYDLYLYQHIAYLPIGINVLFPPIFMTAIIVSTRVPGEDNTRRILGRIRQIIGENPDVEDIAKPKTVLGKKVKARSTTLNVGFSMLYLLAFLISFGFIFYVLTMLKFNIVSQGVFIVFLTLVSFFAYRIRQISKEYLVDPKEGVLTPVIDFLMLPLLRVGQWLSDEISRINFIIFLFDFIIEAPFKAIFEVIEEWIHFVRIKKEEMV